jgi:hypothetical protein
VKKVPVRWRSKFGRRGRVSTTLADWTSAITGTFTVIPPITGHIQGVFFDWTASLAGVSQPSNARTGAISVTLADWTAAINGWEDYPAVWTDSLGNSFSLTPGQSFSYTFEATDVDGDSIDFLYGTLPSFVTLTENTQSGNVRTVTLSGTAPSVSSPGATDTYSVELDLSTEVPGYIASLAPYQVAALSTVTNSKPKWIDAVDPLYDSTAFTAGGTAVRSVRRIVVESGGFSRPSERKFYALGGGHTDGAYNGILEFDLNGTTQANGWSVVPGSESALADIPTGYASQANFVTYLTGGSGGPGVSYATTPQAGGKAGSTHNYGAMCYDETSNRMVRFGGSYWSTGTGPQNHWVFDFNTGEWVPGPTLTVSIAAIYGVVFNDTATRKCLYLNGTSGLGQFYNFATAAIGNAVTLTGGIGTTRVQGGYDPTRGYGIIVGKGFKKLFDINFATETISNIRTFTVTPATAGDDVMFGATIEGVGVEYDPILDRFWIFGGAVPASPVSFNKIYWFDAADLVAGAVTVRSQALTTSAGAPFSIPFLSSGAGFFMGMYRRYCFIPEWRALAVATTYDQPVHVIRLPG